jgi:hypothetical protein
MLRRESSWFFHYRRTVSACRSAAEGDGFRSSPTPARSTTPRAVERYSRESINRALRRLLKKGKNYDLGIFDLIIICVRPAAVRVYGM